MKKLLFLVIIAIALCAQFSSEDDVVLQGFFKKAWKWVKGAVSKAVNWLKKMKIWNKLVDLVKTYGPTAAKSICNKYKINGDTCEKVAQQILN